MIKTYNKISAALLAAVMIVIPSCSKKDPAPVSSSAAPSVASSDAKAPAETSAEQSTGETTLPAPVFAYEGQLEVIASSKATWYVEGDADMKYAITDLDMNGRYEITAAKKNLSFNVYEVTADNSGIAKVSTPFEAGSPGPYMEEEYKLRMNSNGEYLYVAREYEDTMNEGEVTIYYYVVSLLNGQLRANQVATEIRTTDESGNVNIRYGDDEFEITADEFKKKTDTGLPAVEHILKVSWGDGRTVAGLNDAKALESICFKLTK